jgi:hypothetical protein
MPSSQGAAGRAPTVVWEHAVPAAERRAAEESLARPEVVATTLARLHGLAVPPAGRLSVRHLATGGARRVYRVRLLTPDGRAYPFVLKRFLPVKLAHLPPGATLGGPASQAADLDARLLDRMLWAARRIDDRAPGLCPRFGGFWEWHAGSPHPCRVTTEAYVEGWSLERWKAILEERFVQGTLDFAQATAQRRALERRAIAAYVRLWDVLGRRTFTSDPSPWNVLFTPTSTGLQPVIIDLHSLHDGGTPLYLFQVLEEQFGSRDEVREGVLCPGVLDALGPVEGRRVLRQIHSALEAQAELRRRAGLTSYAAASRSLQRFLRTPTDDASAAPTNDPA